ncbi:hypothetical protein L2E82_11182 [Cichorium intybus]|uniref:Uncharacterized protein n=1 Tax=Cichorium intybus TaxID=13427 RepID=A0ACB9GCI0_CICIN|nr:hypothetical protein L2E82_11182 [Cichorium intybus]
MVSGCLVCKNFHFYGYLNMTTRCPLCYLRVTGHHVFESFVEWFQAHARKTVVLGGSSPRTIAVLEDGLDRYGPAVPPKVHGMGTQSGSLLAKPKTTRKSVSINHQVEYIEDYIKNKKGKRKRMEQWPSMEIEGDEVKPLKSILKVGSKQI